MLFEKRIAAGRPLNLLAFLLGVKPDDLTHCCDLIDRKKAYHMWSVPKAGGGRRQITSPAKELKAVQRAILHRLLYQITVHAIAHGFTRNRDIMTNADVHANARTVFNIDLKNAFPSIRSGRVMVNLKRPVTRILKIQYSRRINPDEITEVLRLLVKLCINDDCLPQGTPTSPALLNIVCLNLDRELFTIAAENGLALTRYADDITFSTTSDFIPGHLRQWIRSTISQTGWKINQKKVQYLRRANGNAIEVTGLLIQKDGTVTIPENRRKHYRAFLFGLLERDTLTEQERATALGIIVYCSRVYRGQLPRQILNPWLKVKARHGFRDAPTARRQGSGVDMYMPDLLWPWI